MRSLWSEVGGSIMPRRGTDHAHERRFSSVAEGVNVILVSPDVASSSLPLRPVDAHLSKLFWPLGARRALFGRRGGDRRSYGSPLQRAPRTQLPYHRSRQESLYLHQSGLEQTLSNESYLQRRSHRPHQN
jgi:hypothetical protein